MGATHAGLAHHVEDGATFSMAARLAAAHHRDLGADTSRISAGYRSAVLTQLDWALAYAVLWRSDTGGPPWPWPQLIRSARNQGPVALTRLQRVCSHLQRQAWERNDSYSWALGTYDIASLVLPPFVSACQGCRLMFYTSRRRRQTCTTCQKRQERHKKRALRGTDLTERTCPVCSTTFTPRRSDARCCSAKCRAKLSRQQATATALGSQAGALLPVGITPHQDQQIETDIVRVFTDLGNNVPAVAEPGNNVPTIPSEGQDFKVNNVPLEPCGTELPDSPPAPSDNLTNSCDSSSPQGGVVDPLGSRADALLQADSLDEACRLAHQLGWPRGVGVAIAERFGVRKQSVSQRKQKLARQAG